MFLSGEETAKSVKSTGIKTNFKLPVGVEQTIRSSVIFN